MTYADRELPVDKKKTLRMLMMGSTPKAREAVIATGKSYNNIAVNQDFEDQLYTIREDYIRMLHEREEADGTPPAVNIREFLQSFIDAGNNTRATDGEPVTVDTILEDSAWDLEPSDG